MGIIVTKTKSGAGGSGAYTNTEKLVIEMEMEFKASNPIAYKELAYTDGTLTGITIYEDNTKAVTLFTKVLSYTTGLLTQYVLTRILDSKVLTKTFTYDVDDNLESIGVSIT